MLAHFIPERDQDFPRRLNLFRKTDYFLPAVHNNHLFRLSV
jgi:hypothetical protein